MDSLKNHRKRAAARRLPLLLLALACLFGLAGPISLTGCVVSPEPYSEEEHWQRAMDDKARLYANQEPLEGPLTLPMAIARALTYNYDYRLSMLEGAFQSKELTAANLGMLPKLTANAGYSMRDKESASRSISYYKRTETLEPSVSQERKHTMLDLSFNWSILDFGISYFQAKQTADRYLIMRERQQRVVNNIVKDVIAAYWRAVMAEEAMQDVRKAMKQAEKAVAQHRKARKTGLTPLLVSLNEEKALLQVIGNLRRIHAELEQAKLHLAALTNLPPDQPLRISVPSKNMYRTPPRLSVTIGELEDIGLALRPDLREELYQERIDKQEVYKEVVRLVPGVNILASGNYDSNKYLRNNWWSEATLRASSNLLGLPAGIAQYKAAKTQVEVSKTRRLAGMVAALVHINLAYYQYNLALDDFQDSATMHSLERQIYKVMENEAKDGSISGLARVNGFTDLISARMNEYHSVSMVYEAWGNLYFSIGGNIVGQIPEELSLEEKAGLIEQGLQAWWQGALPERPALPETPASPAESDQPEANQEKVAENAQ